MLCAPSSIEASDHPHPLTAPACKQLQTFVNVRRVPIRGICTECSNICENMFSVAEALDGGSFALLWLVNKAALWCHSCGGIRPEVTIIRDTICYFMGHSCFEEHNYLLHWIQLATSGTQLATSGTQSATSGTQ